MVLLNCTGSLTTPKVGQTAEATKLDLLLHTSQSNRIYSCRLTGTLPKPSKHEASKLTEKSQDSALANEVARTASQAAAGFFESWRCTA